MACSSDCNACLTPGTCEPALPRRYRLFPLLAYVPPTKPDGSGWDADGSGPDLYVEMSVDGAGTITTATANDLTIDGDGDFSAVYSGTSGDYNLVFGSSIDASVNDEDLAGDDGAFVVGKTGDGLDAARLLLPTLHRVLRAELEDPLVVAAPHRDTLLAATFTPWTVGVFQEQVEDAFRKAPHPISAAVFALDELGLRPLDGR